MDQVLKSTGEMAATMRQHKGRVAEQAGGRRHVYRCLCKTTVRESADLSSRPAAELGPGDIIEEVEQRAKGAAVRVAFETVWAPRGPNLAVMGWVSAASGDGEQILEALPSDEAKAWRQGKPAQLRRATAVYKSLSSQQLRAGAGGGVYRAENLGVIRAAVERESEKVGELMKGQMVAVRNTRTLPSGQPRVQFDSVWLGSGPNLGAAGWASIAGSDGGVLLSSVGRAEAESWQAASLELLVKVLGRQGVDVKAALEEQEVPPWKEAVAAALAAQDAGGGRYPSPATCAAMAGVVTGCVGAAGVSTEAAALLRTLAGTLQQAASRQPAGASGVGDEV